MIDLDALSCASKESLMHGIHSQGHIVALRMPVAVRACRLCGVGLCLHPHLMTIFLNHRTTTLTTHLHRQTIRIGAVSCVAVETTSWYNGLCDNGIFIKRTKFALIDAYITTHLIAWFDTTIGKSPVIKTSLTYKDIKVFILGPLPIFLRADSHGQLATLILFCQRMPFVDIKISPFTVHMKFPPLFTFNCYIHTVDSLIGKVKIQGSDIGRNRHTYIIGIDFWQLTCQCRIIGS